MYMTDTQGNLTCKWYNLLINKHDSAPHPSTRTGSVVMVQARSFMNVHSYNRILMDSLLMILGWWPLEHGEY